MEAGTDPGGRLGRAPTLKPTKVTLFTIISYNSENSIRDIKSCIALSQQFCEVYFISLTATKLLWDLTTKYYWKRTPPKLTGWARPGWKQCLMELLAYSHGRRKGGQGDLGSSGFWKFQQNKVVFFISSGKKQISPLLALPLEKFCKNPLAPPLEKILPTPMHIVTPCKIRVLG